MCIMDRMSLSAVVDRVSLSHVAASNVRAETARRRISQAAVARRLGLSRMSVSDRYRGRTPWSVDELEGVASLLGVDVGTLFTVQDDQGAVWQPALRGLSTGQH